MAHRQAFITDSRRPLASEKSLYSLIDDQALCTKQRCENDHLIWATLGDAAGEPDDMPDEAEVADMACGAEEAIGKWVTADCLEESVGLLVEPIDHGTELLLARNYWNG